MSGAVGVDGGDGPGVAVGDVDVVVVVAGDDQVADADAGDDLFADRGVSVRAWSLVATDAAVVCPARRAAARLGGY